MRKVQKLTHENPSVFFARDSKMMFLHEDYYKSFIKVDLGQQSHYFHIVSEYEWKRHQRFFQKTYFISSDD